MKFYLTIAFIALFSCGPPGAICGNGSLEDDEVCDDGNNVNGDGCRADCLGAELCGDGLLDALEECDDENLIDADGCEADCTLPACENGIQDPGELCFVQQEIPLDNLGPQDIITDDFNSDGFLDLAVVTTFGGTVKVLLNQGEGEFILQTINLSSEGSDLVSGDFDGNGSIDLAVILLLFDEVILLFNDGEGNFPTTDSILVDIDPNELTVGDFDGDTDLDLAVSHDEENTVVIFSNNGLGDFAFQQRILLGNETEGVTQGDFDQNEVIDLVVGIAGEDQLQILSGTGDGEFIPEAPFNAAEGPTFITVADFDGDRFPDLAVSHTLSDEIQLFRNQGDSTFSSGELVFVLAGEPRKLAAGDLDNDGDVDLIAPDLTNPISLTGEILLFLNEGKGTFSEPIAFEVPGSATAVTTGDFNNDGLLDVAASGQSEGVVVVLFSAP